MVSPHVAAAARLGGVAHNGGQRVALVLVIQLEHAADGGFLGLQRVAFIGLALR